MRPYLRLMIVVGLMVALLSPAQARGGICTSANCRYLPTVSLNAGAVIINGFTVAGCNLAPPFGTCVTGDVLNRGDRPVGNIVVNGWFYNTQLQLQQIVTETLQWPVVFPGQSLPIFTGIVIPEYPSATVSLQRWTPIVSTTYRALTVVTTTTEYVPYEGITVTTYLRNDHPQSVEGIQAIVWAKYNTGKHANFDRLAAGQTISFKINFPYGPQIPPFEVTAIGKLQSP